FKTKKELDDYFAMLEEAKKRDHRKLGRELELFVFDDDVGPGLPMFLPRGAVIAEELEKLAKETEFAAGYQRVRTPHIARESLYKKSGHLPYYAESMFPWMQAKRDLEEEKEAGDLLKEIETDEAAINELMTFFKIAQRLSEMYTDINPFLALNVLPSEVQEKYHESVTNLIGDPKHGNEIKVEFGFEHLQKLNDE